MRAIYKLLILLILGSFSGMAQSAEELYLQQENNRLVKATQTEEAIEVYISQNMGSYSLPPPKLAEVTNPVVEGLVITLTGKALQEAIIEAKLAELRKLYFQQNPSAAIGYEATLMPLNVTPCINSNFQNGLQGFSFASQRLTSATWNQFANFPTAPVLPTTTGIVQLVQQGIDPNTVNPNPAPSLQMVFNNVGTNPRAIRLNNGAGGNYDVSVMRRNFIVTTPTISFNFALVLQNGHQSDLDTQSYFQYRLINNALPVSDPNRILIDNHIVCDINDTQRFHQGAGTGTNQALYTDWSCEVINTAQFQNMNVTLEIIVADCGGSAHYGYAYLDNFCNMDACTVSTFGDIVLNPVNSVCPTVPVSVTGSVNIPAGNTLTSISLDILNSSGTIINTLTNFSIVGNIFTFSVPISAFGTAPLTGTFDFRATAVFTANGVNYPRTAPLLPGPDVSFNNCITGALTLNPVNENCPLFPLPVSGTFSIPQGASVSNFQLQILNNNGVVVGQVLSPVIVGTTFSFSVLESHFGPAPLTGNFEFRVSALVTLGGSSTTIFKLSANNGADVSFSDCSICCPNCCVDNQSLASPVLANYVDTRQANLRIHAANVIHNNAFASYHAGDYVLLKPGFNAMSGSRVHVYNVGCTGDYILRPSGLEPIKGKEIVREPAIDMSDVELIKIDSENIIQISPNPNDGLFKIKLKDISEGTVEITDIMGKSVFKKLFSNQDEFEFNLQDRPNGIYIVRVVSNNLISIEKIIKN